MASLLNRKSAKQCKARWHEWLDPAVRKVEWSRSEEEKLLHLAKLMPAQWKTIGPLVGRTAAQCQEHYEYLLDQAATTSGDATSAEGGQAASASLRNFQPGQIDSHPEAKPARPDPIDMDEDEIEMLQEARARLANTQGKKAKRKAREKMLAQAKRLADLQKRRELKQAGILSSAARKKARKKNKDIDLGVEIPFHKPAPAGFHDTSSEDAKAEEIRQNRLKDVNYKKVNENLYKTRDREAAQAKKREQARLRALEKSNMQYVVNQVSKTNDPLPIRKRSALELPAPAVSDKELGQLAKLQAGQSAGTEGGAMDGSSATQALLGDYSDRPLPTPMRTPAAAGGTGMTTQESLLKEASQLRKLEQSQTPLLGATAKAQEEDYDDMMEMEEEQTVANLDRTPGPDRRGVGQTPSVAPPRDELGLNRRSHHDDAASVGASTFATSAMSIREMAREERRAAKRARLELEKALAALPAPQYEYELALPQNAEDMDADGPTVETVEKDAADVEAEELERLRKKAEKLYEARSSVVKRKDLPRPKGAIDEAIVIADAKEEIERLIRQEMATLLQHDAYAHPVVTAEEGGDAEGKKKKKKKRKQTEISPDESAAVAVPLEYVPEEYLDAANDILQKELQKVMEEKTVAAVKEEKASNEGESMEFLAQQNSQLSSQNASDKVYVKGGWNDSSKATLESLNLEFETLKDAAEELRKKNEKTQAKIAVVHGGYTKRAGKIRSDALQSHMDLQNAIIEEEVYRTLQSQERTGAVNRIEKLKEEIAWLEGDEAAMQKKYSDLLVEKRRLMVKQQKT